MKPTGTVSTLASIEFLHGPFDGKVDLYQCPVEWLPTEYALPICGRVAIYRFAGGRHSDKGPVITYRFECYAESLDE